MQTLAVVGYSNTGKTMVVRQLAGWFRQQGIKVAVLKHASHGYDLDVAGKDSHSYYTSGVEVVAVAGPESFTIHRRTAQPPGPNDILGYLDDCDLVLVEGYKNHPGVKVELIRQGISEERLDISGVVAVVTDLQGLQAEEPIFTYTEIDRLAAYLWHEVLGR
ncbi:MAG: molybdopterin-guanine dinucleotide biosynthesis protein B [Methylocystaceae bacterium]